MSSTTLVLVLALTGLGLLAGVGGVVVAVVALVRGRASYPTPGADGVPTPGAVDLRVAPAVRHEAVPPSTPGVPSPPHTVHRALLAVAGPAGATWTALPGGPGHSVDVVVHWEAIERVGRRTTSCRYAVLMVLDPAARTVHALQKLHVSGPDGTGFTTGRMTSRRSASYEFQRDERGKRRLVRTSSFSTRALDDALADLVGHHGWTFRPTGRLPARTWTSSRTG